MTADLRNIPITSIRENPVALRAVNQEDEQYLALRHSINQRGVRKPIEVREKTTDEGTFFEIIDGLHRYTAAKEAGRTEIPVVVVTASDAEALELQIVGNLHNVTTAPAAYSKQLQRMFALNPTMTLRDMAERVSQSESWVSQRLSLTKLDDGVAKLVDDGKINLSNAYALAKLPREEQINFVDAAMTMQPAEFVPTVQNRAKEIRDAARQGRASNPVAFEPVPHLRKLKELKTEVESGEAASSVTAAEGSKTAKEGFIAGIKWALSLDTASVTAQKAKHDARVAEQEANKKKNALERAEKKEKEAQEAKAKLLANAS